MAPTLTVTHIGTATAILEIDNELTLLTDPYFSPAGTSWDHGPVHLESHYQSPLTLADLPPIDAVLLSHEDHADNLDPLGRQLLDARKVFTTRDGARNLAPRKGVVGLQPWETVVLEAHGRRYEITGTPTLHTPPAECTGFVLAAAHWGATDGRPNALYFSGDTVWIPELARIRDQWHVSAALFNLGRAAVPAGPGGEMVQVTMDGKQGTRLLGDVGADVMVPMHFEGWDHFSQGKEELAGEFKEGGVSDKIRWLVPGVATKIL